VCKSRTTACLLVGLLLAACDGRAALAPDAAAGDASAGGDSATGDAAPRADSPGPFCSGPAKAAIDDVQLAVKRVEVPTFISAAAREGAHIRLVAEAPDGTEWELNVHVSIGGKYTITTEPLPFTIDLGSPPAGFDLDLFVRTPPRCTNCTISDLLSLEHHALEGHVTLAGKDYDGPCQLTLCVSARDDTPDPLRSVRVYHPGVTIPRWHNDW